ncbi:MAG: acetoacetate--CoA ligase [Nitrospinota bacterium]|nr:acetoacetate--CoA ligase [Nitrospinota bacterium]MDH5755383.1 acetoacetate--CoA ligase [Nitrospinota bacterium]
MPENPIWIPSADRAENSNMARFMRLIARKYNREISGYSSLRKWSIQNINEFWAEVWEFTQIMASAPFTSAVEDLDKMPGARWFPGARMNFAENLLRFRDGQPAIVFCNEAGLSAVMTHEELYKEVASLAIPMKEMGVGPRSRVAAFMPNIPQTVVAMLAATSLGATWSSCSPDFGVKGVLDRFAQIRPDLLFTADGYFFKGRHHGSLETAAAIVKEIPSIRKTIVVPYSSPDADIGSVPGAVSYADFKMQGEPPDLEFAQLSASHPLYIMYSSGTTGLPKCMVQSAGGILANQLKELALHTDVNRDDVIFYFTTCGWMMWNWLVCALARGAAIVLYDGAPFHPGPGALWKLAEDRRITIFGTSAGYLAALEKSGLEPAKEYDLSSLKTILSTGSPLPAEGFEFVYAHIKGDLQLSSISGGTDLNGCFALGDPTGAVYPGELQCRGLGMAVEAYDRKGAPVYGQRGELVCVKPFPSMPLYFWDDPDGRKYHHAYFDTYPGVWRHGDYIEINHRGGVVIHGRSDATLNPGGVRIGTAEIYGEVERMDEVEDSLAVGQQWKGDIRVILFVKLPPGHTLTDELREKIKTRIRGNLSPRHVPAMIIQAPDIPYTLNMKKVELAVKNMIEKKPVVNKEALANPAALDFFGGIKELEQ